jgi:hypothetical protein
MGTKQCFVSGLNLSESKILTVPGSGSGPRPMLFSDQKLLNFNFSPYFASYFFPGSGFTFGSNPDPDPLHLGQAGDCVHMS